ncbi:MAG: alpha/beta fold hydrolase, partial [Gammaproteobacteria bacterium]|nr:alpha/beta fold hydrolase [Gammaproteobacteria bacterium]
MRLYYEQYGDGPEVVLVHGWGSHGGVWTDIARVVSKNFRVTVPDLPGHGRSSDFLPSAYTPESLVEELRPALSGAAVWVGWSMGGLVALAAAQRYPREVTQLVLVGATPKYVQSADWPHAMSPTVLDQFAHNLEQDYAGTLERFLTLQMAAGESHDVLRRLRTEMFRYGEPPTAALQA